MLLLSLFFSAYDLHLSSSFFADMCPLKWNIHAHGKSRHIFFISFAFSYFSHGRFRKFLESGHVLLGSVYLLLMLALRYAGLKFFPRP
ncbi:hypothetical protein ASPTUDRAFT_259960 [Aspergillus tubingensis CBS 134.48]|uniref:Uncharacterized protein n=1 Tax=Aspergillus tubingensis (strain CBS 134.48) TaxID=767770 RepID=A0A1L9NN38_ASPTC|nr:hypothetical protein ASPTUDRAFT_259960 [Aspergillus tubingensis CBS 134.48]